LTFDVDKQWLMIRWWFVWHFWRFFPLINNIKFVTNQKLEKSLKILWSFKLCNISFVGFKFKLKFLSNLAFFWKILFSLIFFRCQFHQHFTCAFFVQNFGVKNYKKNYKAVIWVWSFGPKILYEKRARKTLMKLTAELLEISATSVSGEA